MVEMMWQPEGQWWERQGYVVFLHPSWDPNYPGEMTGWVKVTEQRARELLEVQHRSHGSTP